LRIMKASTVAALAFVIACACSLAAEPNLSGRWPSVMSTGMRSSNLERSIRFYTQGLGMMVLTKVASGPVTEVILGFQGKSDQPGLIVFQKKGPGESLPVEHGNADTKVVLGVTDIAAVAARLSSAGYPAGDIQQNGPYKVLIAHDPDGYKYEIVEMPAATPGH
jgi:catechol 2,3-dioxygenase-like lactoylglutathione lyase family enzyme